MQIVKLFRAGEVDEAAEVFYRAVPLMRFEFQEGIGMAIRKEVLHRRGALASPATRAPGAAARRDHPGGARSGHEVGASARAPSPVSERVRRRRSWPRHVDASGEDDSTMLRTAWILD